MTKENYDTLMNKYDTAMEIISSMEEEPRKGLEAIIAADSMLFKMIGNGDLSPEEIACGRVCCELVEECYKHHLELSWADDL